MNKNVYTEEDYIQKCSDLGLQYIGTSKEKKKGTMIHFICDKHKDKGIQKSDWSHFRKYARGCPYCTGRYKTTDEFVKEVYDQNVQIISEYLGCEKPIKCLCKECGNVWTTSPKVLVTNKSGCPVCGRKKSGVSRRKNLEEFIHELNDFNPNIEIIGEYEKMSSKVLCRCKLDGTEWVASPRHLLKDTGCPKCSISLGERAMLSALDELGITYVTQYKIRAGLKKPSRIDAYNEENRIAFEYNGEQHYKQVPYIRGHKVREDSTLEHNQFRDEAKRKYCSENGIALIEIPFWEKNNQVQFIQSELKKKGLEHIIKK